LYFPSKPEKIHLFVHYKYPYAHSQASHNKEVTAADLPFLASSFNTYGAIQASGGCFARAGHGGRAAFQRSELASRLPHAPQPGPRRRRRRRGDLEHEAAAVRGEVRRAEGRRLPAAALGRAVRGEHLLGLRRRRLEGGGRGEVVGGREAVVQLRRQQLRRRQGVRPLHAGGVACHHQHRLRARRLQQQPRGLHHLQLRAPRQHNRTEALLMIAKLYIFWLMDYVAWAHGTFFHYTNNN